MAVSKEFIKANVPRDLRVSERFIKTNVPRDLAKLRSFLREVHENPPSTVPASLKGKRRTAMLTAIAFSKARKAGARLPKK